MEAIGLMTLPRMNRRRITGVDDGSQLLAGGELWRFLLQRSAFGRPMPVPAKAKKIGLRAGWRRRVGMSAVAAECRLSGDRQAKEGRFEEEPDEWWLDLGMLPQPSGIHAQSSTASEGVKFLFSWK